MTSEHTERTQVTETREVLGPAQGDMADQSSESSSLLSLFSSWGPRWNNLTGWMAWTGPADRRTLLSSRAAVSSLLLFLGEESGQESLPEKDFPEPLSTCGWDPGGPSDRSTWSLVCLKALGESRDLCAECLPCTVEVGYGTSIFYVTFLGNAW